MRYIVKNGHRGGQEQSSRNRTVHITIITDQTATANICSLRCLGIFAGTKFTLACRAAIGFIGFTVIFDRRSFNEAAEMVLEADVSLGGWIDVDMARADKRCSSSKKRV